MIRHGTLSLLAAVGGLLGILVSVPAHPARSKAPAVDAIWANRALRARAIRDGEAPYRKYCADCHGADLKGAPGRHAPDLTDAHWLFGGEDIDTFIIRASDVERTILHGIRTDDPATRDWPEMPARGIGHSLEPDEVEAVTEYALKLGGLPHDEAKIAFGRETYEGEGGCVDCHTAQGWGDTAIGAADLTHPETFLYGHDRASIAASIREGRRGVSPAFVGKISPAETRALSVYVLSHAATLKYE